MNVDLRRRVAVLLAFGFTLLAALAGLATEVEPRHGSGAQPAVVLAIQAPQAPAHLDSSALPAEAGSGPLADAGPASPLPAVDRPRPAIVAAPTGRSPPFSH